MTLKVICLISYCFIWGTQNEVAWTNTTYLKHEGGLGLRDYEKLQLASIIERVGRFGCTTTYCHDELETTRLEVHTSHKFHVGMMTPWIGRKPYASDNSLTSVYHVSWINNSSGQDQAWHYPSPTSSRMSNHTGPKTPMKRAFGLPLFQKPPSYYGAFDGKRFQQQT